MTRQDEDHHRARASDGRDCGHVDGVRDEERVDQTPLFAPSRGLASEKAE